MNIRPLGRRFFMAETSSEQLKQRKKQLRQRVQDSLKSLTPDEVARQSAIITSKALRLSEYQTARSLSIFLSMPGKEVATQEIVKQAFKDGKIVYVPYIHSNKLNPKQKVMEMLRLKDEDDLNSLRPDAWGIPSLAAQSVDDRENALGGNGCLVGGNDGNRLAMTLDLIFMPSMAFDKSLNRLGHGKGFYDRYLTICQSLPSTRSDHTMPHLVGLALKEQTLPPGEIIPTSELDWKVDKVVSSDA